MKILFGTWIVALSLLNLSLTSVAAQTTQPDRRAQTGFFHPDPQHLWNRLHRGLLIRTTGDGREFGVDELDPLFWFSTRHLLEGASSQRALELLDEFLQNGGAALIDDPIARAILQHDLWGLFDWLANPHNPREDQEEFTRKLRIRLSRAIHQLALSDSEVAQLPDTYQATVTALRDRTSEASGTTLLDLPADLFDASGPWVQILHRSNRIATNHEVGFGGRSMFTIFVRISGGREQVIEYLDRHNAWAKHRSALEGVRSGMMLPPSNMQTPVHAYPKLPAGTQVALVRRSMLIDQEGRVVPTRLTETVQLIDFGREDRDEQNEPIDRQFAFFKLDRRALLIRRSPILRQIHEDERGFENGPHARGTGKDPFEPPSEQADALAAADHSRYIPPKPLLNGCRFCHSGFPSLLSLGTTAHSATVTGFRSPGSVVAQIVPHDAQPGTSQWKETRYEYALLKGLLECSIDEQR